MASFMDTTQVNTAITDNTKLDLSHSHITTSNPFRLSPVFIRELTAGEKIKIDTESFVRMNPLAVPTFGRMNVKIANYVVPIRTIFPAALDFWTDSPHTGADYSDKASPLLVESVPYVTNYALLTAFTNDLGTDGFDDYEHLCFAGTPTDYDLRVLVSQSDPPGFQYFKLTVLGCAAMTNLEALGYKINPNMFDETAYNALPILCLSRIYADYYFPKQYEQSADFYRLLAPCKYDINGGMVPFQLTSGDVKFILTMTAYSNYQSDWSTASWDVPNQPAPGAVSDFKLVNIDSATFRGFYSNSGGTIAVNSYSTDGYVSNNSSSPTANNLVGNSNAPFISPYVYDTSTGYGITGVSEYLLHGLHAMTDWIKRNQLASSSSFSRFLARFGKAIPAEKLNRSVYLGNDVFPLQFGDVMSTSDTYDSNSGEGSILGDYSGKGLGAGRSNVEFTCEEPSYIITLCSVIPASGCGWQGISPMVKRLTVHDFYQPEYDNLGVTAVTKDEVYMTQGATNSGTSLIDPAIHSEVFGYLPRYWDYRVASDKVTGNFRVPTLNGALGSGTPVEFNAANSWYLLRAFNDATWDDANGVPDRANIVHSMAFMMGRYDAGQYNRIFYNASSAAPDQLTFIHQINCTSWFPGKSLFDTYEFEDKGKKVTIDVGGPVKN